MEKWKTIEGQYEVSNCGNIRRNRPPIKYSKRITPDIKQIKGSITTSGYRVFAIWVGKSRKTYCVHKAVGILFIPNPENKKEVNHKDGNKLNNHISNLEWATPSENIQHAVRIGLIKSKSESPYCKIIMDYNTGIFYIGVHDAAFVAGFSVGYMNMMLWGRYKNRTNMRYV